MADPSFHPYFASTYADHEDRGLLKSVTSSDDIVKFIDHLGETVPAEAALGYADFTARSDVPLRDQVVTFSQLARASKVAAGGFRQLIKAPEHGAETPPCVAMLCRSSIEFAIYWLALLRMGYTALLLAPQLRPDAISHLCSKLKARTILLHHENDADKAESLDSKGIQVCDLSHPSLQLTTLLKTESVEDSNRVAVPDVAFYFHTSGTSSGTPKPIPQHHRQLLVLVRAVDGYQDTATFTTTPMYHGGLPDCLRAWSCGAMVWIFPEDVVPLTPTSICAAFEFAQRGPKPIWYFSSVPFILQMLAEETRSMSMLRLMKLVGVGGAALDSKTGDSLVVSGVKLISRLGSAECGFLMSSDRDFEEDPAWDYLRCDPKSPYLDFVPRSEGLFELIIKPEWPGTNLANRPDGSFATSDLFQQHETIPNAWKYYGRADSQITLINGKKFDPEAAENHIRTSSKLLRDVLVFGNGKEYAGVMLFASPGVEVAELKREVWPTIHNLNQSSQSHARISKSAVVVIPTNADDLPLEKSSKGTVMRGKAESRYSNEIESAYDDKAASHIHLENLSLEELQNVIKDTVSSTIDRSINLHEDLFHQGVDSIAAIQIRTILQKGLPKDGPILSRSIVYDQGTVDGLAKHLYKLNVADVDPANVEEPNESVNQIEALASMAHDFEPAGGSRRGRIVVLTGATGFLGSHILDQLRKHTQGDPPLIDRIICLVRGQPAKERVTEARKKYRLSDSAGSRSISALSCDLSKTSLGLFEEDVREICENAFLFIHCAWTVNFAVPLRAFKNDMIGLENLINMSMRSSAHFVFVSSTASVTQTPVSPVPESISHDSSHSAPLSYGQSKWAAEKNCVKAWKQCSGKTHIEGLPLSIIRVGQLCGNKNGVWNMSEAYPLMLSTAPITGGLPDFPDKVLDWLPVEVAAQAVTEIAMSNALRTLRSLPLEPPVYHVLNSYDHPSWSQMTTWIRDTESGRKYESLDRRDWIVRLQEGLKDHPKHKSLALLGLWEQETARDPGEATGVKFDMTNSLQASKALREFEPLDESRIRDMWQWISEESRQDM